MEEKIPRTSTLQTVGQIQPVVYFCKQSITGSTFNCALSTAAAAPQWPSSAVTTETEGLTELKMLIICFFPEKVC